MTDLRIHVDEALRERAQAVARSMGLDLTTAVRLFLLRMVRENTLPFHAAEPAEDDPFYSAANQAHLARVAEDLRKGENCAVHELIED